jgi:hypothetical protein
VEFALTILLLTAMISGIRGLVALRRTDLVIDSAPLVTMWVSLPAEKYQSPEERTAFYDTLVQRFGAIGGVSEVSLASALPVGGAVPRQLSIDGRPVEAGRTAPTVWTLSVGARYFDTMQLPLVRGRAFRDTDGHARS